ncbi:putative protein phosphatase 2C 52 [Senna tora]|uniref:Uncharacterized protein n=1 Tax=Senna tora TaxID=362788 RepID=A0A834WGY6_9FABA|nr:putative protein phosphatase 2C 52 [Senna tora]
MDPPDSLSSLITFSSSYSSDSYPSSSSSWLALDFSEYRRTLFYNQVSSNSTHFLNPLEAIDGFLSADVPSSTTSTVRPPYASFSSEDLTVKFLCRDGSDFCPSSDSTGFPEWLLWMVAEEKPCIEITPYSFKQKSPNARAIANPALYAFKKASCHKEFSLSSAEQSFSDSPPPSGFIFPLKQALPDPFCFDSQECKKESSFKGKASLTLRATRWP